MLVIFVCNGMKSTEGKTRNVIGKLLDVLVQIGVDGTYPLEDGAGEVVVEHLRDDADGALGDDARGEIAEEVVNDLLQDNLIGTDVLLDKGIHRAGGFVHFAGKEAREPGGAAGIEEV